jgi:hypothetical protein
MDLYEYTECANKRKPEQDCKYITLAMRPYYKRMAEQKKLKYENDPEFRAREIARRKLYYLKKKEEKSKKLFESLE